MQIKRICKLQSLRQCPALLSQRGLITLEDSKDRMDVKSLPRCLFVTLANKLQRVNHKGYIHGRKADFRTTLVPF